jgi:hypothetical protein
MFGIGKWSKLPLAVGALAVPLLGVGAMPASADVPAQYQVSTPWTNYDGGCQAQTELYFWAASNTVQMKTSVYDPYLFAGCWVNAKVNFDTSSGVVGDGPTQRAMACAVMDPTCASTSYGTWETFHPSSATLDLLKSFGADPAKIVNDVRIGFSKA